MEDLTFDMGLGEDFELDFDVAFLDDEQETQIIVPKAARPKAIKYNNALQLAENITLTEHMNYYVLISGNFVFGDFIEALVEKYNLKVSEMYISTLGMSENNVDSIVNLLALYNVEKINLIVSHYFFGVERHNMIPYMIEEFAGHNIDIAVAGSHTKICLIKTEEHTIVMNGSANLSSSSNIEQFQICNDSELYEFNRQFLDVIMENYTVIKGKENCIDLKKNKNNRSNKLWEKIGESNG